MQTNADIQDVYRRHIAMVRACARRVLGDRSAAEDVAQEVFIRFVARRRAGKHESDVAAMLYRMASNLALSWLRDAKRRGQIDQERMAPVRETPLAVDELLAVRSAVARVEPELAEIGLYYYLQGMEQEEIADLLSMQRRTVGRRLERFREAAQALLATKDKGGEA